MPYGGPIDAFTTVGPLARSVDDLALILSVIAGPDNRDFAIAPVPLGPPTAVDVAKLRCAVFSDNGIQTATGGVSKTVLAAARALSDAGVMVEEKRPPAISDTWDVFLNLMRHSAPPWVEILKDRAGIGPDNTVRKLPAELPTLTEFTKFVDEWDHFRTSMLAFMDGYDLLLSPVNATTALPPGTVEENLPCFSYTFTHNLTGWPAAVVRAGADADGLPIGVQIAAKPWREDLALAGAKVVENALGGWRADWDSAYGIRDLDGER